MVSLNSTPAMSLEAENEDTRAGERKEDERKEDDRVPKKARTCGQ